MTQPPSIAPSLPGNWSFWADVGVAPYAVIGPVDVIGFTCNWVLSGFGTGEAVITVERGGLTRTQLLQFWGWRLWAFYEGVPIWAGMPTGLTDDGGSAVTVALAELPGYLLRKQYATTNNYSQVEQTTIAADIAARLDNIGVPRTIVPGSGVKRDRNYAYLDGTSRGDMLIALSQVNNGPEFRSEYSTVSGRPSCSLKIAYPRAGSNTGLGLIAPGGAASFRSTWSSDMMRTRTFAVGDLPNNAAQSATRPVAVRVAPQAGVPELDSVDDWPGVFLASTVGERADTNSARYAGPSLALEATLANSSPPLGTYNVGDDVSLALADPLMPSGISGTGRLTQASADASAGTVTWTVTIKQPPPKPHKTLTGRLNRLEVNSQAAYRRSLDPTQFGGINP